MQVLGSLPDLLNEFLALGSENLHCFKAGDSNTGDL